MHKLATLSEEERRRLIADFLDSAFGGLDPGFSGIMRSLTPELPTDPQAEQVAAWVQLAELSQDPEFRAGLRQFAEQHAADRAEAGTSVPRRDARRGGSRPDRHPAAAARGARRSGQARIHR